MKYTIPYEDKITLPHIKELIEINLKTGDIYQENDDLLGKVIVYGEYTLDGNEDVIEFSHEIPVSLLVDDANIEPEIDFSNLEFELVRGRGIEIMFDLDVTLDNRDELFQNEVDKKLSEVIDVRDSISFKEINEEINVFDVEDEPSNEVEVEAVEVEEDIKYDQEIEILTKTDIDRPKNKTNNETPVAKKSDELKVSPIKEVISTNRDDEMNILDNLVEDLKKPMKPVQVEEDAIEIPINDELFEDPFDGVKVSSNEEKTEFDIGFISRVNDKFTTYKIIILEDGEMIEQILAQKELSKDMLMGDYDLNDRKVVLKLNDE